MTLALYGGSPVRARPFPPRPPYGLEERNAANAVVASGQLSGYLGEPGPNFLGGPRVQSLEEAWCAHFKVKHAIAMNSATSCLFGAVKAVTDPRDEVLVTTWSMSASAACVREAGCSPVFSDIDRETYGIAGVKRGGKLSAIVLVHLFGCPARSTLSLRNFARENGIALIEDAAQAPGATWQGAGMYEARPMGTWGDVGVFSLNRHKQIQCGEGGVAVTNNDEIAESLRRYRNHGEVLRGKTWGGNYRLGEVEAAIAEVQLGRLEELIVPRIRNAERITEALAGLEGLVRPRPVKGVRHVYYLYAVRVPGSAARWAAALSAEGVSASTYVQPLYRLPVFSGFAREHDGMTMETSYPETEEAYKSVVVIPHVHAGMADEDVVDVIAAFRKVHAHRDDL